MKLKNFFFIHIPKTGGTFVVSNLPQLDTAVKHRLPTHSRYSDCKYISENKILFTVVRNPYDWVHSYYFWEHTRPKVKKRNPKVLQYQTFDDFIYQKGFVHFLYKQHEYIDKSFKSENVLKTEYLYDDLVNFFLRYDKPVQILPDKIRENKLKPSINLTEEMKDIIYNYYKTDFEIFGYKK